jgi:hypothetical protein
MRRAILSVAFVSLFASSSGAIVDAQSAVTAGPSLPSLSFLPEKQARRQPPPLLLPAPDLAPATPLPGGVKEGVPVDCKSVAASSSAIDPKIRRDGRTLGRFVSLARTMPMPPCPKK